MITTTAMPNLVSQQFPTRKCWTRAEYERFIERGAFSPEHRLELIEGEIIEIMPQDSHHSAGIGALQETFNRVFPSGFWVRVQLPLASGERSLPEPDVAVVVGSWRDYREHQPTTAVLVVEVSNTTLLYDRTTKAKLYAQAEIPEYWILNLNERILEAYTVPINGAYTERNDHTETGSVTLNGQTISVRDLLP